jgi:AcrR family transcriptional regulator
VIVPSTRSDGRLVRGERSRGATLDAAVVLATEVGLDGLSLSQLAQRLGVSKSGIFAHWASKEELQLAVIDHASQQWIDRIVAPALRQPRGVRRLWAAHEARIAFYAEGLLPGGCFFANAQFEYDARPGPVRDRLASAFAEWMTLLRRLATEAVELGEVPPETDPAQLAFEVNAAGVASVLHSRLLDPAETYAHARRAVLSRLRDLATDPTLLPED